MGAQVLQIAYNLALGRAREMALADFGFSVTSVIGNSEARRLLSGGAAFDVFFVGWSGTYDERCEIVSWLKERWPATPVVAIHDRLRAPIPGANVSATHDSPGQWLAAVESACRG